MTMADVRTEEQKQEQLKEARLKKKKRLVLTIECVYNMVDLEDLSSFGEGLEKLRESATSIDIIDMTLEE
jgi:hypothetical protein